MIGATVGAPPAIAFPEVHYSERAGPPMENRQWMKVDGSVFWGSPLYADDEIFIVRSGINETQAYGLARLSAEDRSRIMEWRQRKNADYDKYRRGIFIGQALPTSRAVKDFFPPAPDRAVPPGVAAMSAILDHYGKRHEAAVLAALASDDGRGGGSFSQARALRNLGIPVIVLDRRQQQNPVLSDGENLLHGMREALAERRPLLVWMTPGSRIEIVHGYDDQTRRFRMWDPLQGSATSAYSQMQSDVSWVLVPFPRPRISQSQPATDQERDLLHRISQVVRRSGATLEIELASELHQAGLAAQGRDANRMDAERVRQKTLAFARDHGGEILRSVLNRGAVAILPQQTEGEQHWLLIYKREKGALRGVRYAPGGAYFHEALTSREIAGRWVRTGRPPDGAGPARYSLPIVEVEPE